MLFLSIIASICFLFMFLSNYGMYNTHRRFKKATLKIIKAQKRMIGSHQTISLLQEKLITSKDNQINDYKDQVVQLKSMIDALSEVAETDVDCLDESEEYLVPEVVFAQTVPSLSSQIDMRSLKSNAMITLYEASEVLENEKKNMSKTTYDKLAKFLRMDS